MAAEAGCRRRPYVRRPRQRSVEAQGLDAGEKPADEIMQTGPCGDATVLDSGDAMVLHGRWKSHEGSENDKKEEKSSKSEKKTSKNLEE